MSSTLQLQPANASDSVVRFDPAAASGLTRRAEVRRPVRMLSLVLALVAGIAAGGLLSLDAASAGQSDVIGIDAKTEAVAD